MARKSPQERAARRALPDFLRADAVLADPTSADGLEARFADPILRVWLVRHRATLVRPTPDAPYWAVWRDRWFLGRGRTPRSAIARARNYFLSWVRSRPLVDSTPSQGA